MCKLRAEFGHVRLRSLFLFVGTVGGIVRLASIWKEVLSNKL